MMEEGKKTFLHDHKLPGNSNSPVGEFEFPALANSISDEFFIVDNNLNITYYNDAAKEFFGLTGDSKPPLPFDSFYKQDSDFFIKLSLAQQNKQKAEYVLYKIQTCKWTLFTIYPSIKGLTILGRDITKLKGEAAELQAANERFELMASATNELFWDYDLKTGNIYRNQSGLSRVCGIDNDDSLKTNEQWNENIHPEDRGYVKQQLQDYIHSDDGMKFNFTYRFKRDDGAYNYIRDKGYLIRNSEGQVIRMVGSASNITEELNRIDAIQESELRYKMFVKQSTEGIWRVELLQPIHLLKSLPEMLTLCMEYAYVAECNDAFAKFYGYENAKKIIGTPLKDLMPLENPVNQGYLNKFFSSNCKVKEEVSFVTDPEGNTRFFLNNMIGIIEGDHLLRAWGTQREITDQKKTEASLQNSEEKYRYLFQNNPSCIFIWDLETLNFIEVNQMAINSYGYTKSEFMDLDILNIIPEKKQKAFMDYIKAARNNEHYKSILNWEHLHKNLDSVFMEIASQNIIYNGRKAVLSIGTDVTEKIQLEKRLLKQRRFAHQQITDAVIQGQEKERSELGQELHDNINQILSSTRLYIEYALTDKNKRSDLLEKGRSLLDDAMKEIRILSRTLLPPSLGEVSLMEAINDLIRDSTIVNHIEYIKQWDDFDESEINKNLKLTLFRIVQEQLSNIHKHSKADKVIISLMQESSSSIFLSISDNGIGFDTETKKSGIGLKNISSRAEVNNGLVCIDSSPGNGCVLSVRFTLI